MKHITLIWPNLGRLSKNNQETAFNDNAAMEPLPLATLAALIPQDIEVKLIDDRFEKIPYENSTGLVCISIEIFTARRGYEIADEYLKRKIPVIIGGIHANLMPQEAKNHATSVFIGDAESIWHEVIEDWKNNNLKPFYYGFHTTQIPKTFPRRNIYKSEHYLPIMLTQFGRGCTFSCSFCAIAACFNSSFYYRKINDVVEEIKQDGRKFVFFVDDNIVANYDAAKKLFKALIPLKIKWMGQASIDMTNDTELMSLMQKSGCLGHVIGFESINSKSLNDFNKLINLHNFNKYKTQIKILEDYGLQIWAAFVIGNDHDTPESIKETLDFVLFHKFAFSAFNVLMPYPKTPLYEQLKQENRLLYKPVWWLHPEYVFNKAAFIPKNFSPNELTDVCYALRSKNNNWMSITARIIKAITTKNSFSAGWFLLKYSYLFRKELFKKRHLKLGNLK